MTGLVCNNMASAHFCNDVQAVQPKLEAMEAAWYRLHSISGAATPDQVIAYWEGTAARFQTGFLSLCVIALRKPSNICLSSYKLIGWIYLLDNTLQDSATPISRHPGILNCAHP